MRTVFFLFSLSLLLLAELFFGTWGLFIPLVWFGCFYFGAKEGFVPAAVAGLFFGALDWGVCGREPWVGMLAALLFAAVGGWLRDRMEEGAFSVAAGAWIFFAGTSGALWLSALQRGVLQQEWGLLTAQTVFWAFGGILFSRVLCGILDGLAARIGAQPGRLRKKGGTSWKA